jgi:hypothetical protein
MTRFCGIIDITAIIRCVLVRTGAGGDEGDEEDGGDGGDDLCIDVVGYV